MSELFHKIASRISIAAGTAQTFLLASMVVILWAVSGPLFDFSSTWQLFINTCTTIVTFLMVFIIQNTQNRDGKEMQLKLDELIRSTRNAREEFMSLEFLNDEELKMLDDEFNEMHLHHQKSLVMHKLHSKISAEHKRRTGK